MDPGTGPGLLLPYLDARETWVLGLVLVLAVLRPVGYLGWAVAFALGAAGAGSVLAVAHAGVASGLWQALPWVALALLLVAAAAGSPLRWEPRTGPSAATALLVGAGIVHAGFAWHAAADAPLVSVLALAGVAATVWGASLLARGWGYTGTARATAAAVAWMPPLLLAHAAAPVALLATAALVWSWWALGEVWAGRRLSDRMAFTSGVLLGAATAVAVWPAVLAPLWARRAGGRRAGLLGAGALAALVVGLVALLPVALAPGDVWRGAVVDRLAEVALPAGLVALPLALALVAALPRVPLTPTRLCAVTAALLVLVLPWWPEGWQLAGAVAAAPFVLLTAVAPDRPDERWPPDAAVVRSAPADASG